MSEKTLRIREDPLFQIKLRYKAFDYQTEAVNFLQGRNYGAIFHEQGLGKTKMAIDLFCLWLQNKKIDSVLIITKKNLVFNWKNEIGAHTNLRPKIIGFSKSQDHALFFNPSKCFISHYEALVSEAEGFLHFAENRSLAVILDESQKIKNPSSKVTEAVINFGKKCTYRLILTGTPVANRPYDIWSQIYFLDQGKALGEDFKGFKKKMDLPSSAFSGDDEESEMEAKEVLGNNLETIFQKIKEFSIRETKDGGKINLPRKEIQTIYAEWEKSQQAMYKKVQEELRIEIFKGGELKEDVSEDVLKRLLRLVQIASNPSLIDDRYDKAPGKYDALKEILEKIDFSNEKVILWSSFRENIDWLAKELTTLNPLKLYGQIAIKTRNATVEKFMKRDKYKILIATPSSSKEGLTLTVANHVIFYDRTFSLDDYSQAQDRIHRISQKRTCFVYNIILRNSIDDWVDVLLKAKNVSAKLAQGDISVDTFKREVNFDYLSILQDILNPIPGR